MNITKSTFVKSVASPKNLINDGVNQIAFVGRSNVGKSSLINMLVNNGKLARTSNTPGRTRLINYFLINDKFYFVDLPGYGYAKASKTMAEGWQSLIEPYIVNNPQLKCVCVLLDSRHAPNELDKQMIDFLVYYNVPFLLVATKCDKFSKSAVKPTLLKLANAVGVGISNIYGTSSSKKTGKEELLKRLEDFLG